MEAAEEEVEEGGEQAGLLDEGGKRERGEKTTARVGDAQFPKELNPQRGFEQVCWFTLILFLLA